MKFKLSTALVLGLLIPFFVDAQSFTRQDTLRGSITPERAWWDLTFYHLDISVSPQDSSIAGTNTIKYKVLKPEQVMQIDLQPPMEIDRVEQNGLPVDFERDGNVYYLTLKEKQVEASVQQVEVHFSGRPKISQRPPWDGGFTWVRSQSGKPFIATSCQGDGASLWWPCKDHMYDEADSVHISVTVPEDLWDVSNGRLIGIDENADGTRTYNWFVSNPISNYVINVNVGDYAHFSEVYEGEKGALNCDYYVLKENLAKAKEHFREVPMMLEAFEHWFGPYPFYEDGYKLVEVPYLGMEHQSSVTYGNGYKKGYNGWDLSGTGWGKKFDFIIIHESGHEWFANNITYKDIADMWIHEGFTAYSENLYLDYHYGKEASAEYVIGTRARIMNDRPIIGQYNVNHEGSSDMYYKGANMLHTLRQMVDDDDKWRNILRGINQTFYHQTVTTQQIEQFLIDQTGLNLQPFFDQYLRTTKVPTLEYKLFGKKLQYRWTQCVENFDMPLTVRAGNEEIPLSPTTKWQTYNGWKKGEKLEPDPDFYVKSIRID